jgi:hypothetical protein
MYRSLLKEYKDVDIPEDFLLVRKLATRQITIADLLQGKTERPSTIAKKQVEASTEEDTRSIEELAKDRSLFFLPAHPSLYYKEKHVQELRARGRGAPKKGQGKRSALKKT